MRRILAGWALVAVSAIAPSASFAQDLAWAKKLGGLDYDYSRSVAVDASGNVYTTGYFSGTADFDPGPGVSAMTGGDYNHPDIFVSKLDRNGNFVWAKKLGGFGFDYADSIAVDGAGNVYTTGAFYNAGDFDPGPGTYNLGPPDGVFISKLDSAGNFVWARALIGAASTAANAITVDGAGNVYTTGSMTDGTADFDPGPGVFTMDGYQGHVFISKLDSGGNFVWAKQVGGMAGDSIDVDSGGSGGVLVAGRIYSTGDFDPGAGTYSLGPNGVFVLKLDSAGTFVWAKQFGGNQCVPHAVAVDGSGNVYTTGEYINAWDFDPGPGTYNLASVNIDVFISKLDSAGDFVWAKRIGGNINDWGYGLTVDSVGTIYATGVFEGTVDFDPGAGAFELTTASTYAAFVVKLDSSGGFVWAGQMGGAASGVDPRGIALDGDGNVLTTGTYYGTADFDPGPSTGVLAGAPSTPDVYVTKIVQRPTLAFADRSTLTWAPTYATASYNVYRSDVPLPGTFSCFASHQVDPLATDPGEPSSDAMYAYLVTAVAAGGAEGSLGFDAVNGVPATERPNTDPCP